MDNNINKDLLIEVLIRENKNLSNLTKSQADQIKTYREIIESFNHMQSLSEQIDSRMSQLTKSYNDEIQSLQQTVITQDLYIKQLTGEVKEVEPITSSIVTTQ